MDFNRVSIFFGISAFILSIFVVFFEGKRLKNSNYRSLKDYSQLDVEITKKKFARGFIDLNDSIIINSGTNLVKSPYFDRDSVMKREKIFESSKRPLHNPDFNFVNPPFRLIKLKEDSLYFYVLMHGDTFIFSLE